jgi:hypothetical protein
MSIPITFEFGIVVRRQALAERAIALAAVLRVFEVSAPLGESADLLSFGPSFGSEACDEFKRRLTGLGFAYVDDFFDLHLDHPSWLQFSAAFAEARVGA